MAGTVWFDVVQIAGALLVLTCFLLAQFDRIDATSYRYLLPNLAGSAAMTVTAVIAHEWGFVFLEGTWALVSTWGVSRRLRGAAPTAVH